MSHLRGILGRPPFNSPWVRATLDRWALPVWFLAISVPGLILPSIANPNLFSDARLYLLACRTWLAGGDPWSVQVNGQYFAAPPPTLLPLVPFAVMPDQVDTALLGALCCVGGWATLRAIGLPMWWLLFPPMVQGMLAGNLHMLLIPLILRGAGWAAPILKTYAGVTLALRGSWRHLGIAAIVVLVTAPLLPWATYIDGFAVVNARLAAQSSYGPSLGTSLVLLPVGAVCLWLVGRERAAWLAVPALWPSQQWYYATLILPARSRMAAVIIAAPIPLAGFLALVAVALAATIQRRHRDSRDGGTPEAVGALRDQTQSSDRLQGPSSPDDAPDGEDLPIVPPEAAR